MVHLRLCMYRFAEDLHYWESAMQRRKRQHICRTLPKRFINCAYQSWIQDMAPVPLCLSWKANGPDVPPPRLTINLLYSTIQLCYFYNWIHQLEVRPSKNKISTYTLTNELSTLLNFYWYVRTRKFHAYVSALLTWKGTLEFQYLTQNNLASRSGDNTWNYHQY